jgi:hypothetical protein
LNVVLRSPPAGCSAGAFCVLFEPSKPPGDWRWRDRQRLNDAGTIAAEWKSQKPERAGRDHVRGRKTAVNQSREQEIDQKHESLKQLIAETTPSCGK